MTTPMSGFVEKHPWMTFFLAIFAISGAVAVIDDTTGVVRSVAGLPPKKKALAGARLPPKTVA